MDLGAYTGDTIAEFIGYAVEWRRITALEPDPVTFAKLERNTAGLHDCILYRLGAYSRYARLPFAGGAGRGSHLAAGGAMTELDSVDNILCGQTVSLINMDVEGMEAEAIAGMAKTLRRHRLEPKVLRFVQKNAASAPSLLLMACRKDGGTGLTVQPPLLLQNDDGTETPELRRIYFKEKG